MEPKLFVITICALLLVVMVPVTWVFAITTWYVDDSGGADFATISAAVAAAAAGDAIIVKDGTYVENVVVDKRLTIQSENGASSTMVVAMVSTAPVFDVDASGTVVSGFSVLGPTDTHVAGIELLNVNDCIIQNNDCSGGCYNGIHLGGSSTNNTVIGNYCHGNTMRGISVRDTANGNFLSENTVENNAAAGFCIKDTTMNNVLWLNNVVGNPVEILTTNTYNSPDPLNYTYNGGTYVGYLGNYWDTYIGSDADGDGVGDTPHNFGTYNDNYPLMTLSENYVIIEEDPPALEPMNLTIVALNGTELVLNEIDISALNAVRGVGAYRNQLGVVKNLGNYTGPSLNTFLGLVGGMTSDNSLRITAPDNYTKTYSYAEVNGALVTYDNVTGLPVEHNQSLTPILAYHYNDANVSLSDGPLRTAIVGPEGLATGSTYWVKQVVKLEIRYRDEVTVSAVAPLKTVVGQSCSCRVNVTVQNIGGYTETFDLTLFANTSIATTMLDLEMENGTESFESLTWNATGFEYGNYTIKATASTVPDETNTTDNTYTSMIQVHVGVPGDVSSATSGVYDGTVNMRDIAYLIILFNTKPTSPNWNPNADINDDGVVNMRDIAIAILNFNKHE